MAAERRLDILNRTPEVGDYVAYSSHNHSQLKHGRIIGFSSVGLPIVVNQSIYHSYQIAQETGTPNLKNFLYNVYYNTPKSGYVILREYWT